MVFLWDRYFVFYIIIFYFLLISYICGLFFDFLFVYLKVVFKVSLFNNLIEKKEKYF